MTPGSPEWARTVTASKVAGILGLSPWDSPLTTWLKMRGDLPSDDGSNADAKSRGHYLETGVISWWKDQHPDLGEVHEQQHLELWDTAADVQWGAATPDLIGDDDGQGRPFVMDAKTAASDDDWSDEPPAYYLAQSLWQLACYPEAEVAYIAVLFGRPNLAFRQYVIERDDALIASVIEQCRGFYQSLADDDARPTLDDSVATYEAIRRLHPDIDRDTEVEVPRDLAAEYVAASVDLKDAETRDRHARAQLLDLMGRARLAKCEGLTVARRQPNRSGVSLVRVAKHIDPTTVKEAS